MVFSDTTTKNGAIQRCEDWLFGSNYGAISNNPNLLLQFTNLINTGLDKTKALLLEADNTWQDDDPNYTTYTYETTDLADGIAEYRLDRSHGILEGVEVLFTDGNYYQLTQIDNQELLDTGYTETTLQSPSGIPQEYDIKGDILTLLPAPASGSVTLTDGLKVRFKRESKYHASTDTDVEIGVPRMFQDIPVVFACNEYAKTKGMKDKVKDTTTELQQRTADLKDFMSKRNKVVQNVITSEEVNSI